MLHDIGKVAIPENILNKSGPLNPDEWDTMKSHVIFGAKILDPLSPLARIREMVLHHHEYFDGSGYPDALAGEQIPLGARIIAVADAFDTITSDRTYKKARAAEDALKELERCANAQFDGSDCGAVCSDDAAVAESGDRNCFPGTKLLGIQGPKPSFAGASCRG